MQPPSRHDNRSGSSSAKGETILDCQHTVVHHGDAGVCIAPIENEGATTGFIDPRRAAYRQVDRAGAASEVRVERSRQIHRVSRESIRVDRHVDVGKGRPRRKII